MNFIYIFVIRNYYLNPFVGLLILHWYYQRDLCKEEHQRSKKFALNNSSWYFREVMTIANKIISDNLVVVNKLWKIRLYEPTIEERCKRSSYSLSWRCVVRRMIAYNKYLPMFITVVRDCTAIVLQYETISKTRLCLVVRDY